VARTGWLLAAALAATATLAGCATVPTTGRPELVKGVSQPGQPNVQPIPPLPQPGVDEQETVQGFIAASASFADHHAVARMYLDPRLRRTWRPSWAAAVVSGVTSKVSSPSSLQGRSNGQSFASATVTVTAQQLATISAVGRYDSSPAQSVFVFKLEKSGDQWLITSLPRTSSLLLTQADFEQVYEPRNLYLWSASRPYLVPYPVFAPQETADASPANVAGNLVTALLTDQAQASWLGPDTTSAFPRGTRLRGVTFDGSVATVNLGGAATSAGQGQLRAMDAQLVVTLTSTSYSQTPLARYVTLEVNGRPRTIDRQHQLGLAHYQRLVPGWTPRNPSLYFVNLAGEVSELSPGASQAQALQRPLSTWQHPFRQIAVSGGSHPQLAATITTAKGCVIYYGPLSRLTDLRHRAIPLSGRTGCTSVSWDSDGNIWVVANQAIWVMTPSSRQPIEVPRPPVTGSNPTYKVLSMRVAPDGVRAALLIEAPGGTREVVLTGISGSGSDISFTSGVTVGANVSGPTALSWYDPDYLLVLAQSQLYEVPVNGGAVVPVGPATGAGSITAAGPGQIATGGGGQILTSSGPDQNLQPVAKGSSPTYPG
jgi:hypothetical protein